MTSTGFTSSGDIAFDTDGNLWLSATSSGNDQLVSFNSSGGVWSAASIGDIGYSGVYGLNFDAGTLYGFTVSGRTITLDTNTGVGTFFAENSIPAYGADGVSGVAPVPEPSTILLLGCGLVGLAGISRRKKK